MKNKFLIIAAFILMGNNVFAQTDTLNVYLEKNQDHRSGVNLVFENNSNDTIFVFPRFENFSFRGGIIPSHSGIYIEFFYNNKPFTFNWGEMPTSMFAFARGENLIPPMSKIKLFFDVGRFFQFPEQSSDKYEVSFLVNYVFTKYGSSEMPTTVTYFETNRVTIIQSTKDDTETTE